MEIRLRARHTDVRPSQELIELLIKDNPHLTERAIRDAATEGLEDRSSGMQCMCQACEMERTMVVPHLLLRAAYAKRRLNELRAAGVGQAEACTRIEAEIQAGAALRGATHN